MDSWVLRFFRCGGGGWCRLLNFLKRSHPRKLLGSQVDGSFDPLDDAGVARAPFQQSFRRSQS